MAAGEDIAETSGSGSGSGFGELDCITEGLYGTVTFWRFACPEVFPDEEEEISIWVRWRILVVSPSSLVAYRRSTPPPAKQRYCSITLRFLREEPEDMRTNGKHSM